jgi:pimeloyl-ACP methyl ester carboxylesterase
MGPSGLRPIRPIQDSPSVYSVVYPHETATGHFFNPVSILEKTKIPVLALFGDKDTQVDPVQGAKAYQSALKSAGNPLSQVVTIPNADHILSIAKTGSFKELQEKFRTGKITFAPEYPATLRDWLTKLTPYLRSRNKVR